MTTWRLLTFRDKPIVDKAIREYGTRAFEDCFAYFFSYCNYGMRKPYIFETKTGVIIRVLDLPMPHTIDRAYAYCELPDILSTPELDLQTCTALFHKAGDKIVRQDAIINVPVCVSLEGRALAGLRRKLRKFEREYVGRYEIISIVDCYTSAVAFLWDWEKTQGKKYGNYCSVAKDASLLEKFTPFINQRDVIGFALKVDDKIQSLELAYRQPQQDCISSMLIKSLPDISGCSYYLRYHMLKHYQSVGICYDNVESPFQSSGVEQFKMSFNPGILSVKALHSK